MATTDDIQGIETEVRAIGRTVADLCREAEIARSTWDRWRRGETEPNMKSWRAIKAALVRLRDAAPPARAEDAA